MTRCVSVGYRSGHLKKDTLDSRPRVGTKLRFLYDALRRGEKVHTKNKIQNPGNLMQLRDFYGMEIASQRGSAGYCYLVGEWYGQTFVTAEQILMEDQMDELSLEQDIGTPDA